jgi:hypothetical protein
LAPAPVYASRLLGKVGEAESMLRTPLCRLLGIEHPAIQASIEP